MLMTSSFHISMEVNINGKKLDLARLSKTHLHHAYMIYERGESQSPPTKSSCATLFVMCGSSASLETLDQNSSTSCAHDQEILNPTRCIRNKIIKPWNSDQKPLWSYEILYVFNIYAYNLSKTFLYN